MVVADDGAPALDEVFLLRAVEPELPLGRLRVGFGVDPLSFREVLDRVGDLLLLENEAGEPPVLACKGGVEARRAAADDEDIEKVPLPVGPLDLEETAGGGGVSFS